MSLLDKLINAPLAKRLWNVRIKIKFKWTGYKRVTSLKVFRPVAWEFPVSSPYGNRIHPLTNKSKIHYGIDFACPEGTPVVAAVDGIIEAVGWENSKNEKQGFGRRVRQYYVDKGIAHLVYYAHLSEISVNTSDHITAGTRIGLSGNTGSSSGPHLHFEIRPHGKRGIAIEFKENTTDV